MTLTVADMPASVREDGLVASARGPRADRPKRRTFTPAYKLAIVGQYGQLADARERGALLRREGLYHSHVQQWREAIDKGTLPALSAKPAGRPARSVAEVDNERLRKENEKLAAFSCRSTSTSATVARSPRNSTTTRPSVRQVST